MAVRLADLQPPPASLAQDSLYTNSDGTWSRKKTTDNVVHAENQRDYPPLLAALRETNTEIQYILDAGSNDGYSTWLFARAFPRASVVAVEPGRDNHALSVLNTKPLRNVRVLRAALWHNSTPMAVSRPVAAKHLGRTHWSLRTSPARASSGTELHGVSMSDLMRALPFPRIDFLKLDIEGAEFALCAAADSAAWLRSVRYLFLEAHPHLHGQDRRFLRRGHELLSACLGAMLSADMTAVALPTLEFAHLAGVHEWIYFACGVYVRPESCLATCRRWHAGTNVTCSRVTEKHEWWGRAGRPSGVRILEPHNVGALPPVAVARGEARQLQEQRGGRQATLEAASVSRSELPAVCQYCTEGTPCARLSYLGRGRYNNSGGATWRAVAQPPGVAFRDAVHCKPPSLLGVDHVWLPVTHVSLSAEASRHRRGNGRWFYYAAGCSDFYWATGRSLLAINRYDLAVQLEQRRRGGSPREASERIAAELLRTREEGGHGSGRRTRVAGWASELMQRARTSHHASVRSYFGWPYNVSLAELIFDASHGMFVDHEKPLHRERASGVPTAALRSCHVLGEGVTAAQRCVGRCKVRAVALSLLFVGDGALDEHNAALAREACGTADQLDTAILHQQHTGCQCQNALRWATEIWDLRELCSRGRPSSASSSEISKSETRAPSALLYGWANGSRCTPSASFSRCMACNGSMLHRLGCVVSKFSRA